MSFSSTSILLPILITFENPIPCAMASSTVAAHIAPLCDTSAIPPYFGVIFRNVAFIILFFSFFSLLLSFLLIYFLLFFSLYYCFFFFCFLIILCLCLHLILYLALL